MRYNAALEAKVQRVLGYVAKALLPWRGAVVRIDPGEDARPETQTLPCRNEEILIR